MMSQGLRDRELYRAIRDLSAEKQRLDHAIASLESLPQVPVRPSQGPVKKRGRKSMDPAERQEVSERMRKYWAGRAAERLNGGVKR